MLEESLWGGRREPRDPVKVRQNHSVLANDHLWSKCENQAQCPRTLKSKQKQADCEGVSRLGKATCVSISRDLSFLLQLGLTGGLLVELYRVGDIQLSSQGNQNKRVSSESESMGLGRVGKSWRYPEENPEVENLILCVTFQCPGLTTELACIGQTEGTVAAFTNETEVGTPTHKRWDGICSLSLIGLIA